MKTTGANSAILLLLLVSLCACKTDKETVAESAMTLCKLGVAQLTDIQAWQLHFLPSKPRPDQYIRQSDLEFVNAADSKVVSKADINKLELPKAMHEAVRSKTTCEVSSVSIDVSSAHVDLIIRAPSPSSNPIPKSEYENVEAMKTFAGKVARLTELVSQRETKTTDVRLELHKTDNRWLANLGLPEMSKSRALTDKAFVLLTESVLSGDVNKNKEAVKLLNEALKISPNYHAAKVYLKTAEESSESP